LTASDAPSAQVAAARTGRQAAWNYLVFALSKLSALIMTMVLARLLSPEDFGLFALAMLVLNLFDCVKDLGVGGALVQSRAPLRSLAPTALTISVVSGLSVGCTVLVLADLLAGVFAHPALAPMIRVLAATLVISALSTVPASLLRRRIEFRERLVPEVGGAVAKTVVAISLAVAGVGVWSLVYGQLTAVLVITTLYWWRAGLALRWGFSWPTAVELARFGVPVAAITLLAFAIYNVDYLAVGLRIGTADLGLYSLAYRLPELIILNLCSVVSDVLFSSLSRMQDDRDRLGQHYLRTLSVVIAITAPIGTLLAVMAPAVIQVLFGSRYVAAGDALTVIALFTVVYSASFHSGDVYKAIGRPGLLTAINGGKLLVMAGPVWWAAGHSMLAVAFVLLGVEVVHLCVRIGLVARIAGLALTTLLGSAGRPALASAVMAGPLIGFAELFPELPALARLVVAVPLGLASYAVALRLVAPHLVRDALSVGRAFVTRRAEVTS
jgi:O-antigen/teichoic acid export membrane protein